MGKISKVLHLNGIKRKVGFYLINKVYAGVKKFEEKRKLMIWIGYEIGEGTKIVGPVECTGNLKIGENCWIGEFFKVNGNGNVTIGNNCDIGPEVTFQTGGHDIGTTERRAGKGKSFSQSVGDGTWIGGRSTIINNTSIGRGCVVAGCACVTKDTEDNVIVGGVPAKVIRRLSDE